MNLLAIAVLLVFVALPGATALIRPTALFSIVDRFKSRKGRYASGGIRIFMGAIFWISAESSLDPETIQIVAVVLIIAGVLVFLFGQERFEKMLSWFGSWPPIAVRAWGVIALALAVWLIGLF